MDIRNNKLYQEVVAQVAREFDVPETVVYEIVESMWRRIIEVTTNYMSFLKAEQLYCYIPSLGKIVTTIKTSLYLEIVKQNNTLKQEEKKVRGGFERKETTTISFGNKLLKIEYMKDFRRERNKYVNDDNI